jgi:hypothetical protein
VISVIVDDGEMQAIEGQSGRPVDVEIHVDAKRLFAATRASFARWLCRDRVAHISIVTAGQSITVHGAGDQMAPQLVGRNLFRSAVPDAFRQGFRALGYVEGKNFVIEYRSAEGRDERFPGLATEPVRLKGGPDPDKRDASRSGGQECHKNDPGGHHGGWAIL